mgnify:CR=1 FL=1
MIKQKDSMFVKRVLLTTPNKLMDVELSILIGRYVMDILKLDKHLKEKFGYDEEVHGSLNDFINWKFGKAVLNQIRKLLFINN